MVIVVVKYRAPEGVREKFIKQLFDEGLPQACRAEEGNIAYDYYYSVEDPNEVLLLEAWKDNQALADHGKFPHFIRIAEVRVENNVRSTVESFDAKERR